MLAALIARYLESMEKTDTVFANWYVDMERCSNGVAGFKRVIDYSVYSHGDRNMRMIGSVKLPSGGATPGTPWQNLRPLLPVDGRRPWHEYLCTVNDTRGLEPFPIDDELKDGVREWLQEFNTRPNDFISSKFRGLKARLRVGGAGQSSLGVRRHGSSSSSEHPREEEAEDDVYQKRLFDLIMAGKPSDPSACSQSEYDQMLGRYRDVATKMLEAMAKFVHPHQPFSLVSPNEQRGELAKISIDTFVNEPGIDTHRVDEDGTMKQQRLCYWSYGLNVENKGPCQGGQHRAEISVMADLSMRYYCHACRHYGTMVYSPISVNRVNPRMYDTEPPEGFEEGYQYYGQSFADVDVSNRMRPIQALPSGTLYDPDENRTIVLHGGMGTGKSYQTNAYLQKAIPEIESAHGRPARVLSITFRTMLARSNGKTFDLKVYNENGLSGQSLTEENKIACQLDSLLRLCTTVEDEEGEVRKKATSYDIIIMDESESILSHLSSKTLKDKRLAIFKLFVNLVKNANTLIAADADMGERTLTFLRRFRHLSENVEYHRNPFLIREMQYLDYKYLETWLTTLVKNFLDRMKRIFIATNNKKMLKAFERYLREELKKRVEAVEGCDDHISNWYRSLHEDELAIKMITGDIDGLTKTRMAEECNEEWARSWVLGITPVVGAGISFDRLDYYEEAYLFATPSSACPRALNQLLGRVRYLKLNLVHVYIEEPLVKNSEAGLMDYDAALSQTRKRLKTNTNFQINDMVPVENEGGDIFFRCVQPEPDLLKISAWNVMEDARGEHDFRREFIQVLQKNNPTVNYSFVTAGAYLKDTRLMLSLRRITHVNDEIEIKHQSRRKELPHDVHVSTKRLNDAGERALEDDDEQLEVVPTIRKNDIKNFLGLEDNTSAEIMQAYSYFFKNRDEGIEQVRVMCRLFFCGIAELYQNSEKLGLIKPVEFLLALQNERVKEARAKEKVSQEHDPLHFRVKHWIKCLLFICGFEGFDDMPGVEHAPVVLSNLVGHSHLLSQNLDTDETQDWLNDHASSIREYAGIRNKVLKPRKPKKKLKDGERQRKPTDLSPAAVSWMLKQLFNQLFGIQFCQSKQKCTVHGSRCRLSSPDIRDIRIRFSMCRQYLRYSRLNEDWIEPARDICDQVCQEMDIGTLPGMATASSEETPEMSDEDWINYTRELYKEGNNEQIKRTEMSRKRKPTEKQPLNAEQKFEEKWKETVDTYVGVNLYHETKPERILSLLLSDGFKVRTKQHMRTCIDKRRECLKLLKEDQNKVKIS